MVEGIFGCILTVGGIFTLYYVYASARVCVCVCVCEQMSVLLQLCLFFSVVIVFTVAGMHTLDCIKHISADVCLRLWIQRYS